MPTLHRLNLPISTGHTYCETIPLINSSSGTKRDAHSQKSRIAYLPQSLTNQKGAGSGHHHPVDFGLNENAEVTCIKRQENIALGG